MLELLVVLGIIAVLAGILVPTVHRARVVAARTACASNLRAVGQAFRMYAHDNQDYIPRAAILAFPDYGCWAMLLSPYLAQRRIDDEEQLHTVAALQCPAYPLPDLPSGFTINKSVFSDAGWEIARCDTPLAIDPGVVAAPTKLSQVRRSSVAGLLFDVREPLKRWPDPDADRDSVYYIWLHNVGGPPDLPKNGYLSISNGQRHGGVLNVLYFDGHVAAMNPFELDAKDLDDGVRVPRPNLDTWPPVRPQR